MMSRQTDGGEARMREVFQNTLRMNLQIVIRLREVWEMPRSV